MTTISPLTQISASGFDLTPPDLPELKALEIGLTRAERDVLLAHGTEAPFCGGLLENKEDGVYCCRLCGLPLFMHKTKFESGTGWPSFWAPLIPRMSAQSVTPATVCSASKPAAPDATAIKATSFPTAHPRRGTATASIRSRSSL